VEIMNAIVPYAVSDMERMARAIAGSKLFGIQNPEQAMALCLVAQAEGRHPATAAQDYHILQGRPAKKADAMLRDFLANGGKVEWHALSDTIADATFSHPSGGAARIDWTLARAKQAQLTTAMWSKYPRQMLRARCVSEGVRTVFPMATSGMYVPEEVAEFEPSRNGQGSPPAAIADMRDATPPSEDEHAPPAKVLNPATGRLVNPQSANQARKDGRGERAAALANEVEGLTAVTEALAWRTANQAEVATWPPKWQAHLWEKFDLHVADLRAIAAREAGADEDTGEIEDDDVFPGDRRPEAA
jgi:hypothetical protein